MPTVAPAPVTPPPVTPVPVPTAAAGGIDQPTIIAPIVSEPQPSDPQAHPGVLPGGLAIGAVAAAGVQRATPGVTPVIAETPEQPAVLHIRVALPPESHVDPEQIERLVKDHKPAHTAYLLEVYS